jgi:hypothetical protein
MCEFVCGEFEIGVVMCYVDKQGNPGKCIIAILYIRPCVPRKRIIIVVWVSDRPSDG